MFERPVTKDSVEVDNILKLHPDLISVGATQSGSKYHVKASLTTSQKTSTKRTGTDKGPSFQFTLRVSSHAKGSKVGTYCVDLFDCVRRCETAKRKTDQVPKDSNKCYPLPDGATGVSSVFYGDTNADGLTDILVQFSNRQGILFLGQAFRSS